MGDLDALRRRLGAAGVDDHREIVFVDLAVGFGIVSRRDGLVERVPRVRLVVADDENRDTQTVRDGAGQRGQRLLDDEHRRFQVPELLGDLALPEHGTDAGIRGTDLEGAVVGGDRLDPVTTHHRNAIPAPDAEVEQHMGDPVGHRVQLRVRRRRPAAFRVVGHDRRGRPLGPGQATQLVTDRGPAQHRGLCGRESARRGVHGGGAHANIRLSKRSRKAISSTGVRDSLRGKSSRG